MLQPGEDDVDIGRLARTMIGGDKQKNMELIDKINEQSRVITEMRHKEVDYQQVLRVSIGCNIYWL